MLRFGCVCSACVSIRGQRGPGGSPGPTPDKLSSPGQFLAVSDPSSGHCGRNHSGASSGLHACCAVCTAPSAWLAQYEHQPLVSPLVWATRASAPEGCGMALGHHGFRPQPTTAPFPSTLTEDSVPTGSRSGECGRREGSVRMHSLCPGLHPPAGHHPPATGHSHVPDIRTPASMLPAPA